MDQYVILQAQFPQKLLEKQVMVIFQSGHIVLQTDKTIYTPDSTGGNICCSTFVCGGASFVSWDLRCNDTDVCLLLLVFYRVFSLSPGMNQAVESGVRVEILVNVPSVCVFVHIKLQWGPKVWDHRHFFFGLLYSTVNVNNWFCLVVHASSNLLHTNMFICVRQFHCN